jgi:hypothetical protein
VPVRAERTAPARVGACPERRNGSPDDVWIVPQADVSEVARDEDLTAAKRICQRRRSLRIGFVDAACIAIAEPVALEAAGGGAERPPIRILKRSPERPGLRFVHD